MHCNTVTRVNYCVVTMNKMAIGIQRENLTANFWVVLLFASILKPIRCEPLLLKDNTGALEDHWIPKDDMSEESAD